MGSSELQIKKGGGLEMFFFLFISFFLQNVSVLKAKKNILQNFGTLKKHARLQLCHPAV